LVRLYIILNYNMVEHSSDLMKLDSLDKEFILLLDQYRQVSKDYFSLNNSNLISLQNREIVGGNLISYQTTPSIEMCQALCSNNSNCAGANYDTQTEMCVIKSGNIQLSNIDNSSHYAIVSQKMNLLIQLRSINDNLYNILNRSAILVKQLNPNTSTQTKQVSVETQKLNIKYNLLLKNKKELEKLIEENNSLENEYKVSSLMVNQSNLSYFFWSVGALIIIIFAIRIFYKE